MDERVSSLKDSLRKFIRLRDSELDRIAESQQRVYDYNTQIMEIKDELASIKRNWKIIIRAKDPVFKSKLMIRRFHIECRICGDKMSSKKDLKVHLFEKHSY